MGSHKEKTTQLHILLLLLILAITCNGQLSSSVEDQELPGLNRCGRPYKQDFNTRIINGKPAELGAYPWMANLGYTTDPAGGIASWRCAGSLITDRYVITAAHCLHPSIIRISRPYLYLTKVRLGELDLDPYVNDKATPTDFDVEKITYHEDYSNSRKENDIGLIKLKDKVMYTDLIRPICLPPPEFEESLYVGFYPAIAGWGKSVLDRNAPKETRLLEAEVEIKDTASCRANLTSTTQLRDAIIDHRVVCASAPGKDSCQGDSGGPLMFLKDLKRGGSDSIGNYFLMGIVSYGYSCGLEGYPGVYTRVSKYMDWVMKNIN